MDELRSGTMWSCFKDRSVAVMYGLLALALLLIIVLFSCVHYQDFVQEKKDLASKDDVVGVNITVNALVEKMKEVETAAKKIGTCDNGWAIFGRNCYYFSVAKYNWYKARTTCIQKSADLVVINNEDEQKFISGKTGNTPYWIGLTDKEEEGNWTWVDGTDYTSSYKSWMKNEPNNLSVEDCGQVWKEGNWNDKACNENSLSICEKTL